MTTAVAALVPVAPVAGRGAPVTRTSPGFGRAFGRVTVSGYLGKGYEGGRQVPLVGAAVRAYVPGTSTPWPDPLYLDEGDTVPVAFPVATDEAGAVQLWADAPARLELVCDASGYAPQRVLLDLEPPPPVNTDDPYPVYATDQDLADHLAAPDAHPRYLTPDEADELYTPLAHTTAPDPHPVYLTQPEGDARYATLAGGAFSNPYPNAMVFQSSVAGASFAQAGKAVLDTGHTAAADPHSQYATDADLAAHLAVADPHPIYLTQTEGDARYALASALTALTTRVATLETQMAGHTHTSGTIDTMGGAAVLP